MTRVVHVDQPYDVFIGRPSKWGNPFVVGRDGKTREEVIAKYEAWIKTQPALLAALPELRGKRLACPCTRGRPKPCHGAVLARLADYGVDA